MAQTRHSSLSGASLAAIKACAGQLHKVTYLLVPRWLYQQIHADATVWSGWSGIHIFPTVPYSYYSALFYSSIMYHAISWPNALCERGASLIRLHLDHVGLPWAACKLVRAPAQGVRSAAPTAASRAKYACRWRSNPQNKETGDTQSDVSSLHQDLLEERGPAGLILQGLLAPMPQPVRLGVLLF